MFNTKKHKINHADFKKIVEILNTEYKLDISNYAYSITKNRIETFLTQYNIKNTNEILKFIEKNKSPEIIEKYLSIDTTELFRDFDVWKKLKTNFLNKFQNSKNIKIWIPNISSGEELFSTLITLHELKITNFEIKISSPFQKTEENITKNKISQKKLEISTQNYKNYNPNGNIEQYLTKNNGTSSTFKNEYIKNTKFEKINLTKHQTENQQNFDIIIFRNRLIYYNQNTQETILNTIYNSLKPKGLLLIGLKETLQKWTLSTRFNNPTKDLSFYIKKK